MKNSFFKIFSLLLITVVSNAQSEPKNGIYIDKQEYQNAKLEMGFNTPSKNYKIHEDYFGKKIILLEGIEKASFQKSGIWGFRKDGEDYRIYKNKDFKVIFKTEKQTILIYSGLVPVASKSHPLKEEYFFSKTNDSQILKLNAKNLNKTYAQDITITNQLKKNDWNKKTPAEQVSDVIAIFSN